MHAVGVQGAIQFAIYTGGDKHHLIAVGTLVEEGGVGTMFHGAVQFGMVNGCREL